MKLFVVVRPTESGAASVSLATGVDYALYSRIVLLLPGTRRVA